MLDAEGNSFATKNARDAWTAAHEARVKTADSIPDNCYECTMRTSDLWAGLCYRCTPPMPMLTIDVLNLGHALANPGGAGMPGEELFAQWHPGGVSTPGEDMFATWRKYALLYEKNLGVALAD